MTRLTCPHCQALLTFSEDIPAGKAIQCTHCQAPFTVSPADVARGGTNEDSDVHAILVPSWSAAEPAGIAVEHQPKSGILEGSKPRRERPGALMSAPYLPPPTPKEALQSTPSAAGKRSESRGP